MSKKISLSLTIILTCSLWGQTTSHPASEPELVAIMARGQALAEYDAAAWHATDALHATNPNKTEIQRYVARRTDQGWVVAWGRYSNDGTSFLISYEAEQKGNSNDYSVTKHDPPTVDSGFYFHAAKAQELALTYLGPFLDFTSSGAR